MITTAVVGAEEVAGDRDRRGKKPKIPSFESKSYEPRGPEERTYSSTLEALPGESLAKLSRRGEGEHELEKNAMLGAVAEEPAPLIETEGEDESEAAPVSPQFSETRGAVETQRRRAQARRKRAAKLKTRNPIPGTRRSVGKPHRQMMSRHRQRRAPDGSLGQLSVCASVLESASPPGPQRTAAGKKWQSLAPRGRFHADCR
jgi:hypothetical protein